MALLSPTGTAWLTVGIGVVLVVVSGSFALTPAGGETLDPVAFEDTVSMGGTGVDDRRAEAEGFVLPRAEVFYSGYRYVVGYVGIETAASELGDESARRQFGDPLAVYVSDFSTISPTVTEESTAARGSPPVRSCCPSPNSETPSGSPRLTGAGSSAGTPSLPGPATRSRRDCASSSSRSTTGTRGRIGRSTQRRNGVTDL